MPMKNRLAKPALVLVVVGVLIAVYQSGLLGQLDLSTLKARQQDLAALIAAHPLAAIGAFFVLYTTVTAVSIPGAAVLTLAAGALFGLWTGVVLVSFASTLGASLAFLSARFLLRDALRRRYRSALEKIDTGVERDGAYYLFALRLVPVFPFFVINLLAGLTALRLWTYAWVSQLGMLPATLAYVFAGTQIARIEGLGDVLSPGLIGAFVVLGLLPLAMRWLQRAAAAIRVYAGHTRPRRFDYNLLVIGGGSAGLVSAYIGAAVNARVALIEKGSMGGDCLNTGCVPSKALIRTSRLLAQARDSQRYGIESMQAQVDFESVMARVRHVIDRIEPHDSAERYRGLGVDVIQGTARLVSPWEVEVDGRRLSSRAIIVATGARPLVPPLEGLEEVDYLTSETVWDLSSLPPRLVVLGGGPMGSELAQAFSRLGSEVTVVEMAPRLLPREDEDAAAALSSSFERDGIRIATSHRAVRVERSESAAPGAGASTGGENGDDIVAAGRLVCEHEGKQVVLAFDRLLLALGRRARVEGVGLQELGVRLTERGTIAADGMLRTNFPNILVAGDVVGPYQFTHVAAHQAWYAAINGLLAPFWRFKADYSVIPTATFTDPEVARVGLSEQEAKEQHIAVEVTRYGIDDLDRAIADGEDHGYVKVLTAPGSDKVLGATIVGAHAAELLQEFVLAMKHGLGLNKLLGTIHPYPTMSEANKYAAGVWKRAHAPQGALKLARRFFAWRRG
jgi:pyruvate/2-oxoglutarate dehydrogenase complex dihydrolipoamide dehydrogenase (E3) component/uncharacterized membrane protein YdjX (TVP38/TMEM64 family)